MESNHPLMFIFPAHSVGCKHHVLPQGHCPVLRNDKRKKNPPQKITLLSLHLLCLFSEQPQGAFWARLSLAAAGKAQRWGQHHASTPLWLQPQPGHLFPLTPQYIPVQMTQASVKGSFCTSDDDSYLFCFKKTPKPRKKSLVWVRNLCPPRQRGCQAPGGRIPLPSQG